MGLTGASTENKVLNENIETLSQNAKYTVAIARKSECWKVYYF